MRTVHHRRKVYACIYVWEIHSSSGPALVAILPALLLGQLRLTGEREDVRVLETKRRLELFSNRVPRSEPDCGS